MINLYGALPSLLRLSLESNPAPPYTTDKVPRPEEAPPALLASAAPVSATDLVAVRVAAFRAQLERWTRARRSGVPLLALSVVEVQAGGCLSCGQPLASGRSYRCLPCVRAIELVLGTRPVLD